MAVRNQAGKYMRSKFSNYSRNEKGLATWVKVLIGVMIIGTISIVAIVGASIWFVGSAYKDMSDPKKSKATVESIAKFEDPLPKGWQFGLALPLGPISVAMLSNEKAKLNITLLKLPSGGKDVTNEVVVGEYAAKGVPDMFGSGKKSSGPLTVQNKGKMNVGGEELAYVTGVSSEASKKNPQFIGSVIPKNKESVIIVQGQALDSEEYPMDETKTLLGAIKSF